MSVMDGDYAYIGKEVSQPLIHAVSEVCDVRPSDPITYIADSLRKYSRENSKVSDAQSDGDSREQAQKNVEELLSEVVMDVPIAGNKFVESVELPKYTKAMLPAEVPCPYGFASSRWPIRCYVSLEPEVNVNSGFGGGVVLLQVSNNYNNKDNTTAEVFLLSLPCGTEESPTLPPHCIPAEGVWAKFTTREEGLNRDYTVMVHSQHGDPVNTKRLFFLDVSQMPPEKAFSSTWCGFDGNHKQVQSLVKSHSGHFGPSTVFDTDEYGRIFMDCLFGNNHMAVLSNIPEYGTLSHGLAVKGVNDGLTELPLNVNGEVDDVKHQVGGGCTIVLCTGWDGDKLVTGLYMIRCGYSENHMQSSHFGGEDKWKFESSDSGTLHVNGLKDSVYSLFHNRLSVLENTPNSRGQAYTGHVKAVQGSDRTEIFRFKVMSYIHGALVVLCSSSSGCEDATVAAIYLVSVGDETLTAQFVQGTRGDMYPAESADLWTFTLSGKQVMAVGPKGPCKYGILTNFPLDIPETFDSNVACCLATGEADPIKGSVTFTSDCMTCWVSQRSDLTVTDNEVDVLFVRGQDLKMVKGMYAFHCGWPSAPEPGLHLLRIYALKKHVLDGTEVRVELSGSPYELVIQPVGVQLAVNCGSQSFHTFSDVVYKSEFTQFLNLDGKYEHGTRCKALGELKPISAVPQIVCGTYDGYLYACQRTPYAEGDSEKKTCFKVEDIPNGQYTLRFHFACDPLTLIRINGKNVLPSKPKLKSSVHPYTAEELDIQVNIQDSRFHMECGCVAAFALLSKDFKDREKDKDTLEREKKEQQKLADEAEPLTRTFTRKSRQIVGWSSNLLNNPSAQEELSHWNITGSWKVQEGGHGTEKAFVTSYMECQKYQEVNLLEHFSAEYLDTAPPIQVSEWYREGVCGGGYYRLRVRLMGEDGKYLSDFDTEEIGRIYKNNQWIQAQHCFENYGPGVRRVCFGSYGRDDKYWAGHYGAMSSNAVVRVQRETRASDSDAFCDIVVSNSEEGLKSQKIARDKLVRKVLLDHEEFLEDFEEGEEPDAIKQDQVQVSGQKAGARRKHKKQEIRVFVSSTFRDFREEREQIIKKSFREINALCADRGVFFTYVDLRWGITEEQTCHGQTISICLQEIDRCRPYFLCLMGDRFGWCQREEEPDKVLNQSFDYVLKNFPEYEWLEKYRFDCSVTQLEILHGILNSPEKSKDRSFFYLRESVRNYRELLQESEFKVKDAESDWHGQRQRRLRAEVTSKDYINLREYRAAEDVCTLIKQDLVWCLDQDYPPGTELTPLEREAQAHLAFAEARRRVYIGREEYFTKIDKYFESGSTRPLVILGESGSGKSALVANWVGRVEDRDNSAFMFIHFIGSSAESASSVKLLRRLYEEIKQFFGFTLSIPTSNANLARDLPTWLNMAATSRKCYIVLDALNQLDDGAGPGEGSEQDLLWLPKDLPDGVHMLLSTLPGRAFDAVEAAQLPTMHVKPLQSSEKNEIVTGYLEGIYGKTLSEEQKDMIVNTDKTNNPLYLKALMDEVRMFGSFRKLTSKIQEYLTADTPGDLFAKILERLEQDFEKGDPQRPDLVRDTTVAIWCSHRGMSEAELLEYLEIPSAVWSPFYLSLRENLVNRNGLLNFFHDHLRQAIQHKYLPTEADRETGYGKLAKFFDEMPLSVRKAEELPYLLQKCGDLDKLKTVISDVDIFTLLSKTEDGRFELIKAWQLFGDYTQVEQAYSGQLSALADKSSDDLVELEENLADFYMDLGLFTAARSMFDKILESLEKKYSKSHSTLVCEPFTQKRRYRCNHPVVLQLLHKLGEVCEKQKDLQQAEKYFSEAIRRQNKVSSPTQKLLLTQGLLGQATVLYLMDNAREAKKYLVRAREIVTNVLGPTHHYVAAIINKLGQLSYRQGRLQEALAYFIQDLQLTRGEVGNAHPRTAGILNDLALVYDDMNENEAGALYEAALIILCGIYGNQHLDVAVTRFNLGSFYFATSSFSRAKFQYTEALRVYSLFLGDDHPDTQEVKTALQEVSLFVQKSPSLQQEVEKIKEQVNTPEPPTDPTVEDVVMSTKGGDSSESSRSTSPLIEKPEASFSQTKDDESTGGRSKSPDTNPNTRESPQPNNVSPGTAPQITEANISCLCSLM